MTSVYQQEPAPKGVLKDRWPEWAAGAERRSIARRKLRLYTEQHLGMVLEAIQQRIPEPDLQGQVKRFASRSPNLYRTVTDAVAVAYSRGCRRELRDLGEETSKTFASLVTESGIDRKANGLNALSWSVGPTLVSPHLDNRDRLALDLVTPDRLELKMVGDSIEAALWFQHGSWIELTNESWSYYGQDGELAKVVPHSVGQVPAVAFTAVDNSIDFWASSEHLGLLDASTEVAYKMALGAWTRQVSSNRLTVVYGAPPELPPGQSIGHAALPVILGPPGSSKVEVLDRNVPAADYLAEVHALIVMAVGRYGIPSSEVSAHVADNSNWGNLSVAVRGERLGALRDKQVPWLRSCELELWPLVADLIRGSNHELANRIPPGDEVRDALRVSFPDLSSPEDQIKRLEALELAVKFGLSSPVDLMLAARPELTREEAAEEIDSNREAEIERTAQLAERNQPELGQVPDSLAQLQGRLGGQQSGEARREEEENP
ncbi:hypothetical protein OV203_26060 [Nannocystis sp. ILAH1]|uniref:hypothetical protein n=1 Tax=Nannocystis sp. ILAH1 TaxID=2996789 RepID=UPI0022710B1E|nr:hypothetical protein [Nannocystis sp. ILAH1]MCY0990635.1 hypothetical protein [Nannocystis sp. ILAH1]